MNVVTSLFSFQGRMRRRDFWLCFLILIVASCVLNVIVSMALGPTVIVASADPAANFAAMSGAMRGAGLVALILCWPSLAIGVKRCHDRNQTGWWMLLLFIPIIGFFWWLINLGILDGTPGPNQYGPSPKGFGVEEVGFTT